MTRWLPSPLASATLIAIWLLLNQSVSPGQLLLGALFGFVGPLLLRRLDVPPPRMRRPGAVLRLAGLVIVDIVRSNINVARLILRPEGRRPGFVPIPLKLRAPLGLATLACVITAAPGTAWVSYDPGDGTVVIHVLNIGEDEDWAAIIKGRYEGLLMEIFE
ncbi:Na+/H+ antiporter subunit E [Enterovirga rhinocerotis]|uniref:Multisubunit potassium/proton antiporter PhaE subunit n=1 Tax=Enterovirga rhinocerotis TaxID=1339210 RepID=A0A4R7BUV3_9HYPH|nr:Na+/H+ antiporter subunit E [Enterovirga rhinocerotis]TDR89598.1 multisubunit potassium/proton antiporter PhaE subunit [Enterovirga rhinocerotis]